MKGSRTDPLLVVARCGAVRGGLLSPSKRRKVGGPDQERLKRGRSDVAAILPQWAERAERIFYLDKF